MTVSFCPQAVPSGKIFLGRQIIELLSQHLGQIKENVWFFLSRVVWCEDDPVVLKLPQAA